MIHQIVHPRTNLETSGINAGLLRVLEVYGWDSPRTRKLVSAAARDYGAQAWWTLVTAGARRGRPPGELLSTEVGKIVHPLSSKHFCLAVENYGKTQMKVDTRHDQQTSVALIVRDVLKEAFPALPEGRVEATAAAIAKRVVALLNPKKGSEP